jgi:hypothetical protein
MDATRAAGHGCGACLGSIAGKLLVVGFGCHGCDIELAPLPMAAFPKSRRLDFDGVYFLAFLSSLPILQHRSPCPGEPKARKGCCSLTGDGVRPDELRDGCSQCVPESFSPTACSTARERSIERRGGSLHLFRPRRLPLAVIAPPARSTLPHPQASCSPPPRIFFLLIH